MTLNDIKAAIPALCPCLDPCLEDVSRCAALYVVVSQECGVTARARNLVVQWSFWLAFFERILRRFIRTTI